MYVPIIDRYCLGVDLLNWKFVFILQKMRNQLIEIQEYNQSLMHICQCRCEDDNCQLSNCDRLKQIIYHTETCNIRTKRNCPTCIRLLKICFYHAKYCHVSLLMNLKIDIDDDKYTRFDRMFLFIQNDNCTIPLCSRSKQIIMDEQLKERIEQAKLRRSRLVQMSRQLPDHRIKKRPPG